MTNKLLPLFIFILFFSFSSQAQDQLTVTAPESVAGVYNVNISFFGTGDAGTDGVSAPIVLTTTPNNEACDPFTDDLSGKIAMIDRGTCNFSSKVFNAQNQGALAVIICNNVAGTIRMLGGDNADQVKIPNVFMTQDDCNTLKMDLENVQAKLEYVERQVAIETFWGENGEGSFNDGTLGDWTANGLGDLSSENWTVFQAAIRNTAANDLDFFDAPYSPSYHQGFVGFESEIYQRNNPTALKGAELISPRIDCKNCENTTIEAYQYFASDGSRNGTTVRGSVLSYSIDDGVTWNDTTLNLNVNNEARTASANKLRVYLPQLDGQSDVRIKFTFESANYNWLLDDIKVIRLERNNLALINDFYSLPPAVSIPASQITPFQFVTDIQNQGSDLQTNTSVDVDITGPDNFNFETSLPYGEVEGFQGVIDEINPEAFTPPSVVGDYTGTYTVTSDQVDDAPDNNTRNFNFSITDSLYAYENGFNTSISVNSTLYNGNPVSWAWGNAFYFPNGSDVKISTIEVGIGNPADLAGITVPIILYKWDNENGDTVCQANERQNILAFAELEFSAADAPNTIFKLKLENAGADPNEPIILEDDATYILMTEYTANGGADTDVLSMLGNDSRNYFGTVWLSRQLGKARYIPILGAPLAGDNLDQIEFSAWLDNTSLRSFNLDVVPVNRLYVIDKDATSTEELNIVKNFTVSPNPADEFININLDLEESVQNMYIQLSDIRGVIVEEIIRNNLSSVQENINVSRLMAGNYFLTIATEKGTTTKTIIIQ